MSDTELLEFISYLSGLWEKLQQNSDILQEMDWNYQKEPEEIWKILDDFFNNVYKLNDQFCEYLERKYEIEIVGEGDPHAQYGMRRVRIGGILDKGKDSDKLEEIDKLMYSFARFEKDETSSPARFCSIAGSLFTKLKNFFAHELGVENSYSVQEKSSGKLEKILKENIV